VCALHRSIPITSYPYNGHDHDGDRDAGQDDGLKEAALVTESLVGPPVDVGQHQREDETNAQRIKNFGGDQRSH